MFVATRKQMQMVDEFLLEYYSIVDLVDKASNCLLEEFCKNQSVCIVCGGGNNGADGYALAMKLYVLGYDIHVFACINHHLSEACQYYYDKCLDYGIIENKDVFVNHLSSCDVCVDAIFGFGCHSNPKSVYGEMIQVMNQKASYIMSIDVPSGFDCDCGFCYENCVKADRTITFFALKRGFLNPKSEETIGKCIVKMLDVKYDVNHLLCEWVNTVHVHKRSYDGHKGKYGKSFLICGSDAYHGAALLSLKACVASGCGITCLCSIDSILHEVSLFVPEAIHAHDLANIHSYQSILIGCGLDNRVDLLEEVLFHTSANLVIDASSLNDLAYHLDWLENQSRDIILTPHLKEFERLCPNYEDPIVSAIEFAKKYHVIVVLKGPHSVISDGIHSFVNSTGNGSMAIGGCGDVLAGMITSLLAQGYSGLEAAKMGVYLHGKIGDLIAKTKYSVLPSEIVEWIPQVMKEYEGE
ncbi:MAG: NAD(P)H-hydrate dehydratase [Traorella sp.]